MSDDPLWRRTLTGWAPADPEAQELFLAFKAGDVCRFRPRKMRNAGHHRKLFALIKMCVDNSDGWTTESLLDWVKLETGHFEPYSFPTMPGVVLRRPKSISFASMDQSEFEAFFSRAIDVLIKDAVPHISAKELRDAVEMNLVMA